MEKIYRKKFKLKQLPFKCEPNSIYYIRETPTSKIFVYVTDNIGIPSELKDESGSGGIQNIQNTDGNLIISGSSTKNIDLQASFVNTVNSALQPNDNISNLNNDVGYITNFIEIDPIFQASEASLFVAGDKANLDNQSGVNSGDETTSSIQIKRPLKTVNGESLEGNGNVQIDYNDLDNLPSIITNHSGLNLDDGTNPHGTTKSDVGLSNVDNTSDIDKPISTATQEALDLKLDKSTTPSKIYGTDASGNQIMIPLSDFGTVKGTGTTNRISKFTASGTIGNSQIFDNGDKIGIGTTSVSVNAKIALEASTEINGYCIIGGTGSTFGKQLLVSGISGLGVLGNSSTVNYFEGNLVIGATTAGARLDVRAQGALATDIAFRVRNSTDTQNFLVVNGAGDVYNNGIGGGVTNTHFGENTARARTSSYNSTFGNQAGRDLTTGANNTLFGYNAGRSITTANGNVLIGSRAGELNNANNTVAIGGNALLSNISSLGNTAVGDSSLNLTTAGSNTALGSESGNNNTTGQRNTFIGRNSGRNNTTGQRNVYLGTEAGLNQTTGNNNFFVGDGSGRYEADGVTNLTTATNSLFIGDSTRGNASGQTNQIVIGYNAIGDGSNSVVLGNSSITRTRLQGQVIMGSFATAPTGIEGAIYYNSTDKKHYGFNGTTWNALY